MKTCRRCEVDQELSKFGVCNRNKDGLQSYCKACRSELRKSWGKDNKEQVRKWNLNYYYKTTHGITPEEKINKLAQQDGKCGLCEQPILTEKASHLDHNHLTGQHRDILCQTCNQGLGLFKDSQELLLKAAAYLDRHENLELNSGSNIG